MTMKDITRALIVALTVAVAAPAARAETKLDGPGLQKLLGWKDSVKVIDQWSIHGAGKEAAVLVRVARSAGSRAENGDSQLILYRSKLGQARQISQDCWVDKVHDLDGDGVSEVQLECGTAQMGMYAGYYQMVHYRGWKAQALRRSADIESHEGMAEEERRQHDDIDVAWTFQDLDGDGATDLVETVTVKRGEAVKSKKVTRWLFKRGAFARKP